MRQPRNRQERRALERALKKAMRGGHAKVNVRLTGYRIIDKQGRDVTSERIGRHDDPQ